jgi:inosine-uridine nucleoside N-ribohydrolase
MPNCAKNKKSSNWSYYESECGKMNNDCVVPTIKNGIIQCNKQKKDIVKNGDSCFVACDDGYHSQEGDGEIKCMHGSFQPMPKCIKNPPPVYPKIPKVFFIQSGTIDDIAALALLHSLDIKGDIQLMGMSLTLADCISQSAIQLTYKTVKYLGRENTLEWGVNSARGKYHFPYYYQKDSTTALKLLNKVLFKNIPNALPDNIRSIYDGDLALQNILQDARRSNEFITIICTCPSTSITRLWDQGSGFQELTEYIGDIIWMGGTVTLDTGNPNDSGGGNVATPEQFKIWDDKTQQCTKDEPTYLVPRPPGMVFDEYPLGVVEWNVIFDAFESKELVTKLKKTEKYLKIFPLNITNQITVNEVYDILKNGTSASSKLCYEIYSLVSKEPFYRMWNSFAAGYIMNKKQRDKIYAEPYTKPLNVAPYDIYDTEIKYEGKTFYQADIDDFNKYIKTNKDLPGATKKLTYLGEGCLYVSDEKDSKKQYIFGADCIAENGIKNWSRIFCDLLEMYGNPISF